MATEFEKFKNLNSVTGKNALFVIVGIVLLSFIFTSFYTVDPEQVAIVLRFGKYVRTSGPGLNFKLPLGVEEVIKVPVERRLKQEFGFKTMRAGVQTKYADESRQAESEALMLTGDLNCAVVEWIVQYKISDPFKYLFQVRNVEETFRNMSEAAMREVVGDHSVSDVLTVGREKISVKAKQRLQELCRQYDTGIDVKLVVLQDVNPPDPVKPSYNDVNQSLQEKEKMINEAYGTYNREIPKAEGEAKAILQEAEGYKLARINEAQGDVKRFSAVYNEYRKGGRVVKKRIFLETMKEILPRIKQKIIIDEKQQNMIPFLDLKK